MVDDIRDIDRRWIVGLGCAAALVLVVVAAPTFQHELKALYALAPTQPNPSAMPREQAGIAGLAGASAATADARGQVVDKPLSGGGAPSPVALIAPMIARTVSLTVRVKEAGAARLALEAVVARHHGYTAQMTASSAEGAAHEFQASLRIPAGELAAALKEIRTLGLVENETQSGEEVTQQHQDLVARLKNSRETETRLQAILAQRTGRISDVLEVEQEIARVRGEIESMEAEQAGLERRVDFASVDLSLVEQYKVEFGGPADSVGTRVRNSFVTGFRNAGGTVLGIVLLFEEYGPTMLVWGMLLALPGIWVWRRYRRMMRAGWSQPH